MFPIKLTEHHYVNLEIIATVEFQPQGQTTVQGFFEVVFRNHELGSLCLYGDQAVEAFSNWKTAYEEQRRTND